MLTLRPTKMLARRLKIAVPATPPPVRNRVADWCVHEFRDGGYRYLIFCNTASLYPLVTYARGVNDEGSLIDRGIEAMRLNFVGTEFEFQFQRWILPELAAVQWAPIPDRAVLGSINELILMARHGLDKSPVELSRWLAEAPMKMLGMDSPDRVFPKLRCAATA
ncbi:MAG TPA: hypothetical protein VK477_03310 [Acidobacteriota bacterium]|nr:hypothetical protein [Acidobacteriota bacterium]